MSRGIDENSHDPPRPTRYTDQGGSLRNASDSTGPHESAAPTRRGGSPPIMQLLRGPLRWVRWRSTEGKWTLRVFTRAYRGISRWYSLRRDFHAARDRLLASMELTTEEKSIIQQLSLRMHRADTMYVNNDPFHYLSVGLSASRCIRQALGRTHAESPVRSVLDLPCGYGRVLRFLRVMFPQADITAVELNARALDFCRRSFAVATQLSQPTIADLSLPQRFDLIWCGSLFTHLDEQASRKLLRFFYGHLSDQGVCVFTTHGQRSIDWIQSKQNTYGLTEGAQHEVVRGFQSNGYGYADYPDQTGYGVSAVSHQRMLDLAKNAGNWHEIMFMEHGWDDHQDVLAFGMPPVSMSGAKDMRRNCEQ